VCFLSVEIPVWILFFALGVTTDKEIVDLINFGEAGGRIENILCTNVTEIHTSSAVRLWDGRTC
jgi:DNA-directed RNA polymerase IV and V subunit 2